MTKDSNHYASRDESVERNGGELYRLEIRNGKKVFSGSRPDPAKAKEEGRVKLIENVFAVDALVSLEQIAAPNSHPTGETHNLRPTGKCVRNCEDEETETSQNVPLETIDLGSFEVLSDHGEVDVDESTHETTEMMPTTAT